MHELDPSVAQRTRRKHTVNGYVKGSRILAIRENHRVLDYGSGHQVGAEYLRSVCNFVDTYEPYPAGVLPPTYVDRDDIPTQGYDRVLCMNVLSAISHFERIEAVRTIGRTLDLWGLALILARGQSDLTLARVHKVLEYDYCVEYWVGYPGYLTRSVAYTIPNLSNFVMRSLGKGFQEVNRRHLAKLAGCRYWNPWVLFQKVAII